MATDKDDNRKETRKKEVAAPAKDTDKVEQPGEKETTSSSKAKAEEKAEQQDKEAVKTSIRNRTNQKQVVAYKGETFEFLAGETKQLEITEAEAKEKFGIFISKSILTIN